MRKEPLPPGVIDLRAERIKREKDARAAQQIPVEAAPDVPRTVTPFAELKSNPLEPKYPEHAKTIGTVEKLLESIQKGAEFSDQDARDLVLHDVQGIFDIAGKAKVALDTEDYVREENLRIFMLANQIRAVVGILDADAKGAAAEADRQEAVQEPSRWYRPFKKKDEEPARHAEDWRIYSQDCVAAKRELDDLLNKAEIQLKEVRPDIAPPTSIK